MRCAQRGCPGSIQDGYCDHCGLAPLATPATIVLSVARAGTVFSVRQRVRRWLGRSGLRRRARVRRPPIGRALRPAGARGASLLQQV